MFIKWHHLEGPELKIPFADGMLELEYGWTLHLVLMLGMLCTISGGSLAAFAHFLPDVLITVFGRQLNQVDELSEPVDSYLNMPPNTWLSESSSANKLDDGQHETVAMDTFHCGSESAPLVGGGIKSSSARQGDQLRKPLHSIPGSEVARLRRQARVAKVKMLEKKSKLLGVRQYVKI